MMIVCLTGVLSMEKVSVEAELKGIGMTSLKSVMLAQKLRDASLDVPLGTLLGMSWKVAGKRKYV